MCRRCGLVMAVDPGRGTVTHPLKREENLHSEF